jgi:dolichol-phosphate mannosyltransferase
MRCALVVPTYQEAENIEGFLRAARLALPDAHIVVCDDASPDGTGELAEKVGADIGGVEVLHRPSKDGLGAAYRHGFAVALEAGHEIVIQMDVDFSHPHSMLPAMVAAVEDGADVVVGSRYIPGGATPDWSMHRRLLSSCGNLYARWALGLEMRDATSGFRAYRASALRAIRFETTRFNGYGFQIETAYRLGWSEASIVEHPLVFMDRVRGTSKMSIPIMIEDTALVTWWGVCRRFPHLTDRFRRSALGRRVEERHARSIRGT